MNLSEIWTPYTGAPPPPPAPPSATPMSLDTPRLEQQEITITELCNNIFNVQAFLCFYFALVFPQDKLIMKNITLSMRDVAPNFKTF